MEDNPHKYNIRKLADKWARGTISPEEKEYFEQWYGGFDDEYLQLVSDRYPDEESLRKAILYRVRRKISRGEEGRMRHLKSFYRVAAAISLIVLLAAAGYFLFLRKEPAPSLARRQVQDILPGGNKAVLTLSNGTSIVLDSMHTGRLASQGNSKIIKVSNGLLAYQPEARPAGSSAVAYNTLTVPRGGEYQLVLSDGTRVWLNAASSIRYPTAFEGRERTVSITGEAYFEVAGDPGQPFRVQVNDMTVQVLGTHFDVMAYEDESAAKVTLLEGSVKVKNKREQLVLKPGEQAVMRPGGGLEKIDSCNAEGIIAWTHDQFWFHDADIQVVMRQISRWYDVDVTIKGNIPEHFEGYIPRNVSVSKIFEVLQQTNLIHFSIDHNSIIVSP